MGFKNVGRNTEAIDYGQTLSPDNASIAIMFDNAIAFIRGDSQVPGTNSREVNISIPLAPPADPAVTPEPKKFHADLRGYVDLTEGTRATLFYKIGDAVNTSVWRGSTCGKAGMLNQDFQLSIESAKTESATQLILSVYLLVECEIGVATAGEIALDSIDISLQP